MGSKSSIAQHHDGHVWPLPELLTEKVKVAVLDLLRQTSPEAFKCDRLVPITECENGLEEHALIGRECQLEREALPFER